MAEQINPVGSAHEGVSINIETMAVGDEVASRSFSFTRDSLVRYAGASGDFNPIHYRDDFAQAVGLPGVLAHGMLTMGAAVQPVVDLLGDAGRVIDYQVRFTRPVLVPASGAATLEVTAKVAEIDLEGRRVRFDLAATFEGAAVLGKAQVWVQL
jgi:acyl dehydratase